VFRSGYARRHSFHEREGRRLPSPSAQARGGGRGSGTPCSPRPALGTLPLPPTNPPPVLNDFRERYRALPFEARIELALSADLDPAWRPLLVSDQHAQVKAYFSRRVDLRPEEIARLLADPNQTVRLSCAKRTDLTTEQVEACVRDPDPNLRYFVARNPLLTEEQRQRLLRDPDDLVRIAARKGPKQRGTRCRPGQAEMLR
jgi:hypothetical protein